MNIVVEGPDGAGKSTLIHELERVIQMVNLRVQAGEGPPKGPNEINERSTRYLEMRDTVFDRHPCVSQPIYGQMRADVEMVDPMLLRRFYQQRQVFIYCRARHLINHTVKSYESPEHVKAVQQNYHRLLAAYDTWAVDYAHYIYRIGDDIWSLGSWLTSRVLQARNEELGHT